MKFLYSVALLGLCAVGQSTLNARGLDTNDIISKTWDEIKKKYQSRQEDKELQHATSGEITQRAQKLHDKVFHKYETELACFFKQQLAANEKTLLDETQKLFAHFQKRSQEICHIIDYIRELNDDCKKMEEFVERLKQAKKTAKIQLESKDLEKNAKMLGKTPRQLRTEYQEMIKRATTLEKNLMQLSSGLKNFKKSPVFYIKINGELTGVSLTILDGKKPRQTQAAPASKVENKQSPVKVVPKKVLVIDPEAEEADLKKIRFIKQRFLDPSFSRLFRVPKNSPIRGHFHAIKTFFEEKKKLLCQGLRSLTAPSPQKDDKQLPPQNPTNNAQPHPAIMQSQRTPKK